MDTFSSLDPSIERRRREYVCSGSPLSVISHRTTSSTNDQGSTLSRLIGYMIENNIDGPHKLRGIHLNGKHIGSGAQSSVYGQQHAALNSFPRFDQPFIGSSGKKQSRNQSQVIVAVKYPRFKLGWGSDESQQGRRVGFGTPSQLYALELEILTLCNESIRNHRNIVKLLAWGIETSLEQYENVEPLNIFLVLEHGNCSLREFLAKNKGTVPWQVLRELTLDITKGLSALHSSMVVHGDLKTDNVLVFPDDVGPFFCVGKISDFGLSVTDQKEKVFDIGTPGWQAPELPSDEGLTAQMLMKSDYFSLGLVIFSTMFNFGTPPRPGPRGKFTFELAKTSLSRSRIPKTAIHRFSLALESLLQSNPSDRPSDLERICDLLSHVEESVFDKKGFWINGRFDDNTPWGDLAALDGYTLLLGVGSTQMRISAPPQHGPGQKICLVSHSWQGIHRFLSQCPTSAYDQIAQTYMHKIDEFIDHRSQEEHLTGEIVGDDLTGAQLLGLCFTDRATMHRRMRGSCAAAAAVKGYAPAQAVAPMILNNTHSKLLKLVRINYRKWQWNAVSTGYVLAWKLASEYPDEYESALRHFRSSGGYNTHYICSESYGKVKTVYGPSGLLKDPLAWLSAYPLHQAAVLDDVTKIENLLQYHPVDSNAGIGDTALHMACMAGAYNAMCFLIEHGADPSLQSERFGTVPLHWLFVFETSHIERAAALLTPKKSVLSKESGENIEAFHYPFAWPVGTPLVWAVLSNRTEAIKVLLALGSTLDLVQDFFPSRPDWLSMDYRPDQFDRRSGESSPKDEYSEYRETLSFWIFAAMEKYRSPVVQIDSSYQQQLKRLQAEEEDMSVRARGQDISTPSINGGRLHKAVRENDPEAVKLLLSMGADVDEVDTFQGSPLTGAIDERNPEIIQILLDSGARLDVPGDLWGDMPLLYAVRRRHLGIVRVLLEAGADVNAESQGVGDRRIALSEAVAESRFDMAKLLLEYGANPLTLVEGHEVCLEAAVYGNAAEFVDLFLKMGANPDTSGKMFLGGNSLMYAARSAHNKILLSLLAHGANPNIQEEPYSTALQAAINPDAHRMWRMQRKTVDILLENGADVGVYGGEYGSALQAAACTKDTALVRCLLDAGAPVNLGGGPHGSALQAAVAWNDDLDMVQLLLDRGANPNFTGDPDAKQQSALSLAVKKGNEKQVEILLRRGALPGPPDEHGGTGEVAALNSADTTGESRISRMLRDWDERDNAELDQWNSMMVHVSHPNLTDVRSLLVQRFRVSVEYSAGVESLAGIVNKIIDFAEYWPAILTERHEMTELSGKTARSPYLQVNTELWPGMEMKVQRIVFRIKSHTSTAERPPTTGPASLDEGRYPWLEIGVRSGNLSSLGPNPTAPGAETISCGYLTERTQCIVWDPRSAIPEISDLIDNLRPGDILDIYIKSKEEDVTHPIYVDSAEVIVYYDNKSTPISTSSMTEEQESERNHGAAPTQQPPPKIQGISEKPNPDRVQKETKEKLSLKEKVEDEERKGIFGRVTGFFTCCFR